MTPERWTRVKILFERASALDRVSQLSFLDGACEEDAELRAEVASLLAAHATADAVVDRTATEYLPSMLEPANEDWQGRRIGAYELIACLGRGGMGEVWRARRADAEFEKQVAIKLVRTGYDTAFVLQRFKAERQILATLEHPNIARLIDGGMAAEGQPYLVMELVEGRPIDEYCESHNLSVAERLRLFREVCAAVSYAHQRLVVHRDLKPANILVTADGSIKLLDFGIAKLLQPLSADAAPADATRTTMRALTPAFSSPEQILGLPITTASDVYSLGVVLFHLLAGRSPYRTTLASTRDAIKDVCETEPLKPSAAALTAGTHKTYALLDRDLDDITLKALRKEPEKRYSSVEQLSEDLRRYLSGLPVIARGDQLSYRAGKFLRRHRIELAAAGLVAGSLIAGLAVSLYETRIANQQRARAERHFASVRSLANTFMFQMDDAISDLPGATEARELLVKTALTYLDTLSKEPGSDPALQLELAQAYGKVADIQGQTNSQNTGHAHAAVDSYSKAIALLTPLVAAGAADAKVRNQLAFDHLKRSRTLVTLDGDARTAADESQLGVAMLEQVSAANPNDAQAQRRLASAYVFHAQGLVWAGDTEAAVACAHKAVSILEALQRAAPDNLEIILALARAYNNAGVVLQARGVQPATIEEVLALFEKAVALFEHGLVVAPEHELALWGGIAAARGNMGTELHERGSYAAALQQYQAALDALAKTPPDSHDFQAQLDGVRLMEHRARALFALGQIVESAALYAQALGVLGELVARGDNLEVQYNLATIQMSMGRIEMLKATSPTFKARSAQLQHWYAARDWFTASVPRYERILKGVTLIPQEKAGYDLALAGLKDSNANIATLEAKAPPGQH
ncbi:MAG TPA: protein kinase [Steroidobacteraceae bacterium]|jgi:non-specific serine/threonine protein kinase/serine/threonine-protein kinase